MTRRANRIQGGPFFRWVTARSDQPGLVEVAEGVTGRKIEDRQPHGEVPHPIVVDFARGRATHVVDGTPVSAIPLRR